MQLHAFADVDVAACAALAVVGGAAFAGALAGEKAALAIALGVTLTMILHNIL